MSIRGDVQELESLRKEIKALNERRKVLKTKEHVIETRIQDYLSSKNQPGLKHQGNAILIEEKSVHKPLKTKDRDANAIEILAKYNVPNAEQVMKEIMESRKGETVLKSKVKIQKLKSDQ
jgi:hypothetical protein